MSMLQIVKYRLTRRPNIFSNYLAVVLVINALALLFESPDAAITLRYFQEFSWTVPLGNIMPYWMLIAALLIAGRDLSGITLFIAGLPLYTYAVIVFMFSLLHWGNPLYPRIRIANWVSIALMVVAYMVCKPYEWHETDSTDTGSEHLPRR
jgi:hypothetical protein